MDNRTKPKPESTRRSVSPPRRTATPPVSPARNERSDLQILQSKSLSQAVQETILNMIFQGEFRSGDKLNEFELATRLQVSRGPVREAFRALEAAGLLYASKNRGVFVREVTPEEAEDLYKVRACLESFACRLLAPMVTPKQIRELEDILDGMEPAYQRQDVDDFYPRNVHFHNRIVEMAGSPKLLMLYRNVINEVHLVNRRGIDKEGGRLTNNPEHRAIVAALKKHDAGKAEKLMSNHIIMNGHRFIKPREG